MNMRQNQKRMQTTTKNKPLIIILCVLAALLIIGAASFFIVKKRQDANRAADASNTNSSQKDRESDIDMSPATDEDKQANDQHKDDLVEESQNPATPSENVTPVITIAEQYDNNLEVSSYISGTIEDGGTCILTATQGSKKVTRQTTGVQNAQNTTCPTFIIPRAELPAGSWSLSVKYTSPTHTGTSQAKTIDLK
jgi:flagellar basal body-associated protein FliL